MPQTETPDVSLARCGRICAFSSRNTHLRYLLPVRKLQRGAVTSPRKRALGAGAPPACPAQGLFQAPPAPYGPVIPASVSPCTHRDLLAADPHSLLFAEYMSSLGLPRLIMSKPIVSFLEELQPQSHTQAVATPPGPPPRLVCWVPGGAASLGCSLQTQAVSRGLRILRQGHQTLFLTFLPQRAHCPHLVGPPSSFPRASPVLTAPTPRPSPPLSCRGPGSGNSPSCLRAQAGCVLLSPARVFGLGLCVHHGQRCCRDTLSHSAWSLEQGLSSL